MPQLLEETCMITKILISASSTEAFADWQAKLNAQVAASPGFVSLEILSPTEDELGWRIIQRFQTVKNVEEWRNSRDYKKLVDDLQPLLKEGPNAFCEVEPGGFESKAGVTEVFVTQVSPNKEKAYRDWIARIHQVEAKFPGFKGVYVQSPSEGHGQNWITLLQFDTPENLDNWLGSPEREAVLKESHALIAALESHRVVSPYAGWFSSIAKEGAAPSAWKQTMIVLLVLFPIVMLELKFLSPFLEGVNRSLGTFIGNAISVALVSWPMVPIVIKCLGWWLAPDPAKKQKVNLQGALVVAALYLIEVVVLWNLL